MSETDEKKPGSEDETKDPPEVREDAVKASASEGASASKASEESEEEDDEDGEDEGDGEGAEEGDNPEAIARRVAALGEEDALEKVAREEERKLAERKAAKKGKKKSGLEVAASKKLEKIGKRAEPKRTIAVAADADPLIERTVKFGDWAKKNQKTVQVVTGLIVAGLLGTLGFQYYQHKRDTDASVLLSKAVDDSRARIGEKPKTDDDEEAEQVTMFKTYDDRRAAALKDFQEVQAKFPKTGAAYLARLDEGSLLLDKHDVDGAVNAFNEVKGSLLAQQDAEVRGRAIEGVGFAYELKASDKPDTSAASLDEALKAYKELESSVDVKGFKELAMYHQARVLQKKGDKEEAKKLLNSLKERISKPDETVLPNGAPPGPAFPYLNEVVMDRLREIDPAAAPKPNAKPARPTSPGQLPPNIQKKIDDIKKGKH